MKKHHIPLQQEILSWISFFIKAFVLIGLIILFVFAIGKGIAVTDHNSKKTTIISN